MADRDRAWSFDGSSLTFRSAWSGPEPSEGVARGGGRAGRRRGLTVLRGHARHGRPRGVPPERRVESEGGIDWLVLGCIAFQLVTAMAFVALLLLP